MFQKNNPSLLLIKEGWFEGEGKPPVLFLNVTPADWKRFGGEILRTILAGRIDLPPKIEESPDVVLLEKDPTRKKIGLDLTRNFLQELSVALPKGHFRLGIIPGADELNVESQNALLKTLEEPQKNRFLFLFSPSARNILETLQSRCFKVSLNFSEEKEILDFLRQENPRLSVKEISKIILWAEGKKAQSKKIAQNWDLWKEVVAFCENPANYSALQRLYLLKKWLKNKNFAIDDFFRFFILEARWKLKNSLKEKKQQESENLLQKIKKAHQSLAGTKKTFGANPELLLESFLLSL